MPSCNECNCDTTGSNRYRGRCGDCVPGTYNPPKACVLCGSNIVYKTDSGMIKTAKGNSHTVCRACWEDTCYNTDKYPGKYLPKKKCKSCDKKILKHKPKQSCKTCLEARKSVECSHCWREVTKFVTRNAKPYCIPCSKKFKDCPYCDGEYDVGSGSTCCSSCYSKYSKEVRNYSYKPNPLLFNPPQVDEKSGTKGGVWNRGRKLPYLGFELEIECGKSYRNKLAYDARIMSKDKAYCKDDGTISNGFEMVSHPLLLSEHQGAKKDKDGKLINPEKHMNWKEILDYLIASKCTSHNTKSCGLHVHINKSFMTTTELTKLNVFINSHTQEVSVLSRRSKPSYAPYKKLNKDDFKSAKNGGGGREALNFSPANTVEFRMFKGTLRYSTFIASLQFVEASTRFVKEISWKDICDIDGAWKLFIKFVDKSNYEELSKYIKLKKLRKPIKTESKTIASILGKVNSIKLKDFEEGNEAECV